MLPYDGATAQVRLNRCASQVGDRPKHWRGAPLENFDVCSLARRLSARAAPLARVAPLARARPLARVPSPLARAAVRGGGWMCKLTFGAWGRAPAGVWGSAPAGCGAESCEENFEFLSLFQPFLSEAYLPKAKLYHTPTAVRDISQGRKGGGRKGGGRKAARVG